MNISIRKLVCYMGDSMNTKKKAKNKSVIGEMIDFLKERKAWWLIPVIAALLLVGLLIIFSQSSAISPLIYSLF